MNFLKKHYEKVLLGVMLAGLIGVLIFMIFYINSDKSDMENKRISLVENPHVSQLTNLDLSVPDGAVMRLKADYHLDFETTNKLLNPMEWQRALDGSLIPAAKKTGLQVAVVTNIVPLYLIVTLDSTTTNELGARYIIGVERQAAATLAKRRKQVRYVSQGDKPNDAFALLEVKGTVPDSPDALVLKLVDSGEVVTVAHDKPYRRVDGYAADFRYDPEKKVFRGKRSGEKISFGGVDYVVDDVKQNEVILEDQSNQKKTSLTFVP